MSAYRLSDLSIYLDSSQDLLIAGEYENLYGDYYLFVRSYDLDPSSAYFGQTNTGFGTSGSGYTLIQTTPGNYLYADYLSVDATSGKILLAGAHGAPLSVQEQLVVRLNANGSLDTTFGTSGIASVDIASGNDNAQFVQTLSNGNIVVIGDSSDGTGQDIGVTLLSPSGVEISTSLISIGTFDYFQNARVLSDNSVLLQSTYDSTTTITKLVASGDPLTYGIDATFGASGILAVQQGSSFETLPDGSFLVFQTTTDDGDGRDLVVTKYLANGTSDTNFGTGGSTTLELPETDLNFVNLGVDQDGNITILAEDGNYDGDYPSFGEKTGDLGNVVFELSSTGSLIDTVYIDNVLDESSPNFIWTIPGDLARRWRNLSDIQVEEVSSFQYKDSDYDFLAQTTLQVASITQFPTDITIEPLDLFWTPPSTVSGVTTEGSWDFTTLGAHDFLSLVGENFTSYGLDWFSGYYGVGHSLGSQEVILPDSVTKFLVDQDGFVFEGRQSASEVVVLVGDVSDTTLLFNESNHDMDYLAFVATQGVTQVASANVIVASGVSLDMSNTDSNNEFQVTRKEDLVQIATVSDVEAVSGTSVGDTLKGNDYQNVLFGRGGDDAIIGGDSLIGSYTTSGTPTLSIVAIEWNSGVLSVTVEGTQAALNLDLSAPLYSAVLSNFNVDGSAPSSPITWTLDNSYVLDSGSTNAGDLLLKFIDLEGNASDTLLSGATLTGTLDLAFDQSGGQLSGGTEWLVGGKGADTITSGASQDTVLVDLDEATMVGGVGKDTFVVRGAVSEDGSTHLDTVLGDGATVKGFQVSDYTTSLGGNLGNARDVITFNVSLGWLAAAGLTLDSLNAWDRLYDGQDQLLGADRTLLQQALLHELSVEFVPDATSATESVVQLVDDAGNIGAFAWLSGWILPKELDANSTFSAVLVNTELAPPTQNGGVPILLDMRVNDATAVDVEVLGLIEDALTNFAYTVVTEAEFDTLVLDAWEEVTGQTVTLDQLAVLSPVVNQTITLYDGQVATLTDGSGLDSETRAYAVDGTTAITPYDVVGVDETDLSALISQIDTSHIFEDTVNLSFAIVGERANTVHGLQDKDTPGTLRSNVDNDSTSGSYGQDVATIFTPGRADEVIASGTAADTFEYLRQDLDEAPPASAGDPDPSKGNFGHDVIVDFAGSASADNNVNDLLLIQGVQLDVVDVVEDVFGQDGSKIGETVVSQALDDLFVSKDDFDAEVASPTAGATSGIYASRTTLGDNAVDSSLRVQWTGDGTNPGGDVTLYRQYDPTTDRFRVEKVQLGEDEYSLGDTNAVRDVDGNIVGSIYTTDAEKSIMVGSDNVQETFTSTSSGYTGTMIIGGFQGSDDQIDLRETNFDTLESAVDNGDGTYYITVSDGSSGLMEIFLEGTFNEDDLLLAGT